MQLNTDALSVIVFIVSELTCAAWILANFSSQASTASMHGQQLVLQAQTVERHADFLQRQTVSSGRPRGAFSFVMSIGCTALSRILQPYPFDNSIICDAFGLSLPHTNLVVSSLHMLL